MPDPELVVERRLGRPLLGDLVLPAVQLGNPARVLAVTIGHLPSLAGYGPPRLPIRTPVGAR